MTNERQNDEVASAHRGDKALDESGYIRHRMYDKRSLVARYREIVVGSEVGLWGFIRFELTQLFFGGVPGGAGLVLRKLFYPGLFGSSGNGCVFGRHLTLRHPKKIHLGVGVVVDERCMLDGHGAHAEGVVIGDRVILNRGCVIQAKIGCVSIGAETDVGADTMVIAQGATHIGCGVSIGGGSKIGGGSILLAGLAAKDRDSEATSFAARGQERFSRGEVRIGDFVVLGRGAMVMDGASIGRGAVIAAGAIVRSDIPEDSVVTLVQRLSVVPRKAFADEPVSAVHTAADLGKAARVVRTSKVRDVDLLLSVAIEEVNSQSPEDRQLSSDMDGPLLEPDGPLDSMGLINLIVALEEQVELQYGQTLRLAEAWGTEGVPETMSDLRTRLAEALR